mgnify:CR=1 FL=1
MEKSTRMEKILNAKSVAVILFGTAAGYYVYSKVAFAWEQRGKKLPPVYRNGLYLPVAGAAFQFLSDPLALARRAEKELGDVFTIKVFGQRLTFMSGPDAQVPPPTPTARAQQAAGKPPPQHPRRWRAMRLHEALTAAPQENFFRARDDQLSQQVRKQRCPPPLPALRPPPRAARALNAACCRAGGLPLLRPALWSQRRLRRRSLQAHGAGTPRGRRP